MSIHYERIRQNSSCKFHEIFYDNVIPHDSAEVAARRRSVRPFSHPPSTRDLSSLEVRPTERGVIFIFDRRLLDLSFKYILLFRNEL